MNRFLNVFLIGLLISSMAFVGGVAADVDGATQIDNACADHIDRSYNESEINQYEPLFVTGHLDVQPTASYAYKATSPEHDTDVYVFWLEYPYQQGVTGIDSHFGDHEPVYVYVDEAGEIDSIRYSGYHWLKATSQSPPTAENTTRPTLHVYEPHHHYRLTDVEGTDVQTEHFSDAVMAQWIDNGWDRVDVRSVCDPWQMEFRGYWWENDIGEFSFEAMLYKAYETIGWYGGDGVDL